MPSPYIPNIEMLEQYSPLPPSIGSNQFGPETSDLQEEEGQHDIDEDGQLESADGESEAVNSNDVEGEMSEDVEDLVAEVERLRLHLRDLKHKHKANSKRERKRSKLYENFLRGAPETKQGGWLTHSVSEAYADWQKIVEALSSNHFEPD